MWLSILTSIVIAALVSMIGSPVQAHPLGNFTINHYTGLQIYPDQIEIDYVLDMAEIPTFQTIQQWDPGHNRQPNPEAFHPYQTETCQQIHSELQLTLDQNPVPLGVRYTSIAFPPGVGGLSTLRLTCQFEGKAVFEHDPTQSVSSQSVSSQSVSSQSVSSQSVSSSEDPSRDPNKDPDPIQLQLLNQVDPHRLGWREITVTSDTVPIQTSLSATSVTRRLQEYPTDLLSSPLDQREAKVILYPKASLVDVPTEDPILTVATSEGSLLGREGDPLTKLLNLKTMDPLTIAVALVIAFVWGGFHALTPGHGKTLVGAYLVGSRGTAHHAIWLGLTTTIAHTASIFALGFVALAASQILITEQLYSWLSLISGGTVIAIGGYLFKQRWQDFAHTHHDHSPHAHDDHSHDSDHSPHAHDHHSDHPDHVHTHHHDHSHSHDHQHTHEHPHPHDHLHPHDPNHKHLHIHFPDHDHSIQDHEHHHGHDHTHELPELPETINLSSLLAIGISGGLLPCPSALLVMLGSIGLGRIGFGLALVTAFSLGLAAVLTGIGLLLIYAQKWIQTSSFKFPAWRGWSAVSSLVVVLIGFGMMIQALQQLIVS